MERIVSKKGILGMVLVSTLSIALLAGCGMNIKGESSSAGSNSSNGITSISEMTEDLIAQDESRELTVHYLPQGYAILESAGQAALLGGCAKEDVDSVTDFLSEAGIDRLTHIVVPNGDQSRWSGVPEIREEFGENLVITSRVDGSEEYEQFKSGVGNMLMEVGAGSSFNIGTETLQVLGPAVETAENPMEASLVLWTECGESSFLFCDDATQKEISSILAVENDLEARYIFLNGRGETTLPYSAAQQLSPWEFVVADGAVLPDFGAETPVNLHDLDGQSYSVAASGIDEDALTQ